MMSKVGSLDVSKLSLLIATVLSTVGCKSTLESYICASDDDCNATDSSGRCEPSRHCSFLDETCVSGQRFGDLAGEDSDRCVDPMVDAGTEDLDARVGMDASSCQWSVGFDILNIGPCGPATNAPDNGPGPELNLFEQYLLDTDTSIFIDLNFGVIPIASAVVLQSDGSELFVLATTEFQLATGAVLFVSGLRPLAIVSTGSIQIDGLLGVSADGSQSGAGAALQYCDLGHGKEGGGDVSTAGGGGGGGAYGEPGAAGGVIGGMSIPAAGGEAWGSDDLVPLHGGCPGGPGEGPFGDGGGGGGAIQLVSGQFIGIGGEVRASGGKGSGGDAIGGGSGGGSGGAILLQAPTVTGVSAIGDPALFVRGGGGGGGGGGGINGIVGDNGQGGDSGGGGGQGGGSPGGQTSDGGDGGSGGRPNLNAQVGKNSDFQIGEGYSGGGGGGGGGVGRTRIVEMN